MQYQESLCGIAWRVIILQPTNMLLAIAAKGEKNPGNLSGLLKHPDYVYASPTRYRCGKIFMYRAMSLKN